MSGGEVAFYDGDPDAGGAQIDITQTLTSPFRAATTDTVSVQWNVPSGNVSHTLYVVVDPAGSVSESDEGNNQATLDVVLPDLTVAWTHSEHSTETITLTAAISNTGHVTASAPFSVAFRATDPTNGTLMGAVDVDSALNAGEQVTVSLALTDPASLTGLGDPLRQVPGGLFWAIVDAGDVVDEADEAPGLLVLTALAGHVPHDGLDGEGVLDKALVGVVLVQQCPCFVAGGLMGVHVRSFRTMCRTPYLAAGLGRRVRRAQRRAAQARG